MYSKLNDDSNPLISVSGMNKLTNYQQIVKSYNQLPVNQRQSWLTLDDIELCLFQQFNRHDSDMPTVQGFAQAIPEWASSFDQIDSSDMDDLTSYFKEYYQDSLDNQIPINMWKCPLKLTYVEHNWVTGEETSLEFDTSITQMLKKLNRNNKAVCLK